jgi:hypothetical protein
MTSTELAVAQTIEHTSGTCFNWLRTFFRRPLTHEHHETMASPDGVCVACRKLYQLLVIPCPANQAGSGRFAERHPELQVWTRSGERLVDVLDRLDEMGLAQDHVEVVGLVDRDGVQFHGAASFGRWVTDARVLLSAAVLGVLRIVLRAATARSRVAGCRMRG